MKFVLFCHYKKQRKYDAVIIPIVVPGEKKDRERRKKKGKRKEKKRKDTDR